METKTREQIIDSIIAWLKENEEEYNEIIEDLDSYMGYLGDDRYFSMDELDEIYADTPATEIFNRAYWGYDADS
jgi:hypothetical protein